MEFNDVLGLGKVLPLDKLLDILQKGVGRLTKSYFDRQDIRTEAYRVKELAKAKSEELSIITKSIQENSTLPSDVEYKDQVIAISSSNEMRSKHLLSLEERALERVSFQQKKQQLNIESIACFAAEELKNEEEVSDEPLDEDWISRFFRIAEDISNEDMQALWGKILAGEVKHPKSFSVRTLEVMKNISQEEANIFIDIAKYAITNDMKSYFIFQGSNSYSHSKKINVPISIDNINLLKEVGLIQPVDLMGKLFNKISSKITKVFIVGKQMIVFERDEKSPKFEFLTDLFTTAGNELLRLVDRIAPDAYVDSFIECLSVKEVVIKQGIFLKMENGYFKYKDLRIVYTDKEGSAPSND